MSPHRCQVCGRRKALRQDGGTVKHYVGGVPCLGAGHPPAPATAALEAAALEAIRKAARLTAEREAGDRRHAELRLNHPLEWQRLLPEVDARSVADKLQRRLKRAIGAEPFFRWTIDHRRAWLWPPATSSADTDAGGYGGIAHSRPRPCFSASTIDARG